MTFKLALYYVSSAKHYLLRIMHPLLRFIVAGW